MQDFNTRAHTRAHTHIQIVGTGWWPLMGKVKYLEVFISTKLDFREVVKIEQ